MRSIRSAKINLLVGVYALPDNRKKVVAIVPAREYRISGISNPALCR